MFWAFQAMGDGMAPLQVSITRFNCQIFEWNWYSGVLVVYTLRVNMSVACVDMAKDLNWTDAEKGLVLVSHFYAIYPYD